MSLEERVYSILVVSSSEKFNHEISQMLKASLYAPVSFADSISAARRLYAQKAYDFIVINSPLPDDLGSSFAIDCSDKAFTLVLQLIKSDFYDDVCDKVSPYGVFTLPKPVTKQSMLNVLSWMRTAKIRLLKVEKKAASVEDKMQEIRLVNKAKWLLISKENMDEAVAHRTIEKAAMDRCVAKRLIAEEIIRKYS